jgi:hypothetical protein
MCHQLQHRGALVRQENEHVIHSCPRMVHVVVVPAVAYKAAVESSTGIQELREILVRTPRVTT